MNNYEEIKNLLAKNDFQSAILAALSNSLTFKLTSKNKDQTGTTSIETKVDLLKGITTTASHSELLNTKNELMDFHNQQLENIHKTWNQNRQILITVFEFLGGQEIDNTYSVKPTPLFVESNDTDEAQTNEVDDIVNFMLDDQDDSDDLEVENNQESWLNETEEMTASIDTIDTNDDLNAEPSEDIQENWGDLMGDLSAEEEAVSEEVIVENVSSGEDWSEWLSDDDDDDSSIELDNDNDAIIDWSQEDEDEAINS